MYDHQKRPVEVARARRRVSEYRRQDAPWPHKKRAIKQLHRAEASKDSTR